jgi:hypothetical protein
VFWGRESDRDTSQNLIKRTVFFFARDNRRCRFVASMGLDRDPAIRGFRYKIFSGIPVTFWKIRVCNRKSVEKLIFTQGERGY